MAKPVFSYIISGLMLSGCTGLKNAFVSKKTTQDSQVTKTVNAEPRFLEGISVSIDETSVKNESTTKSSAPKKTEPKIIPGKHSVNNRFAESTPIQVKYAEMLNTPVYEVKNLRLFEFIDEWYGTPYRYGGTTKKGIDCSAFSQYLFTNVYGISLPRTASEQYKLTDRISRTELKEGDLLFFNTRGGVSHVGVYLQNNKFVHASTSGGVMITDIFDNYWVSRFIGVGRLKEEIMIASGM